ncbi:MAG: glycosyltransferase [Alphaproteobacteria bacterium]|nr:glycosyltransferase [Alphaproteobacteria bacterium]MBF0353654.1 glycosyltransferase [Alphaproteobacteria bacterium]
MSQPLNPSVSIIVPTFNEAESIVALIQELFNYLPDGEVVVVDDASTDGTADRVAAMKDDRIRLVRRTRDRGLASAIMRGIIEAKAPFIGWIDADAWMLPPLLPKMIEALQQYDMVLASRFVPGGGDRRHWTRVMASRAMNAFAQMVLRGAVKDFSSNFVVIRREVLDAVLPIPTGYGEFFIELVHRSQLKGLRIFEIPYVLAERNEGISKSAPNLTNFLFHGMRYALRIVMARIKGVHYD